MEPEYWTMGNKIKIVTGIYFSGDVVHYIQWTWVIKHKVFCTLECTESF